MRHEVSINIMDEDYVDGLIISLVHQGYEVYYNKQENCVCFLVHEDEINFIKPQRKEEVEKNEISG